MATTKVWSTLSEVTREHILTTLVHCEGNRTRSAKLLDISIRGLRGKLREYTEAGVKVPPAVQGMPRPMEINATEKITGAGYDTGLPADLRKQQAVSDSGKRHL